MRRTYQQVAFYAILFVLLFLAAPKIGFEGDVSCWARWTIYIQMRGLSNVYENNDVNYNPLYLGVLWAYGKLMGSPEHALRYVHSLKIITLLFDFAGALLITRVTARRERAFGLSLLFLLNIGYLYNTLLWEQVDAIYAFLAAASVVAALHKRLLGSTLLYVLALNMKTQAIIFLPPMLLLWAPMLRQMKSRQIGLALLGPVVLQLLILTPFLWLSERNAWPQLVKVNAGAVETYPFITMGASNFWRMLLPDDFWQLDSLITLGGLTYRQWGLLLFMLASAIGLLPLLLIAISNFLQKSLPTTTTEQLIIFLSLAIVPLLFTYFNTQMHERYWHPALLFVGGYSLMARRYSLFVILSVAYVLQLEKVLRMLKLDTDTVWLFDPYLIGGLFTAVIVGILIELYRVAQIPLLLRGIRRAI